jgi:hypothetical protein
MVCPALLLLLRHCRRRRLARLSGASSGCRFHRHACLGSLLYLLPQLYG